VPTSWPQAPGPGVNGNPGLTGAIWITAPTAPTTGVTNYTLFEDSLSFTLPCTAYGLKGNVNTAANNLETVYINGAANGPTQDDTSTSVPFLQTFPFTPVSGTNTFGFEVTTNLPTTTNPIGVIFNTVITYNLPDVVWRPPIVHTGRTILKDGTTLPIKFELQTNKGILHTSQEIYLSITGTNGEGEVARFTPGQDLTFSTGNGQYIAVFHTKNYSLTAGEQYIVAVNDACSNTTLGSITIQIAGKAQHGHGKK
jgi:hypothetical protein